MTKPGENRPNDSRETSAVGITIDPSTGTSAAAGDALYPSGSYLDLIPTWHVEESTGKAWEILRLLDHARLAPHSIGDIGCRAGEVLRQLQLCLPRD